MPLIHPECVKFNNLDEWFRDNGGDSSKVKFRYYENEKDANANYRCIFAAVHIKAGEEVLFIP